METALLSDSDRKCCMGAKSTTVALKSMHLSNLMLDSCLSIDQAELTVRCRAFTDRIVIH